MFRCCRQPLDRISKRGSECWLGLAWVSCYRSLGSIPQLTEDYLWTACRLAFPRLSLARQIFIVSAPSAFSSFPFGSESDEGFSVLLLMLFPSRPFTITVIQYFSAFSSLSFPKDIVKGKDDVPHAFLQTYVTPSTRCLNDYSTHLAHSSLFRLFFHSA